jgi:hypothetical protein
MTDDTALVSAKDITRVIRYHTDPNCQNIPPEVREWSVQKAENRGLTLCRYCDPDHEVDNSSRSRSLRDMLADDDTELEVDI